MDFDLSDEHQLIRSTVREFAEGEIAPVAQELDRDKRFPYDIVRQLGDLNLMGLPFPERYGGAGGDSLFGQTGPDQMWGGAGDDILDGDSGIDLLDGGPDFDHCNAARGVNNLTGCEN